MSASPHITHKQSMNYGLLALPLAFVALPMYVNLPHFYATQFAVLRRTGPLLFQSWARSRGRDFWPRCPRARNRCGPMRDLGRTLPASPQPSAGRPWAGFWLRRGSPRDLWVFCPTAWRRILLWCNITMFFGKQFRAFGLSALCCFPMPKMIHWPGHTQAPVQALTAPLCCFRFLPWTFFPE